LKLAEFVVYVLGFSNLTTQQAQIATIGFQ